MSKVAGPVEQQDELIIERREIVAIVPLGTGSTSPITVAYTKIGEYMAEHDDAQGYRVGFTLWGREFFAEVSPVNLLPNHGKFAEEY